MNFTSADSRRYFLGEAHGIHTPMNGMAGCLFPGPTRPIFASVAEENSMSAPDQIRMESEEVLTIGLKSLKDNAIVCILGSRERDTRVP
jgi:hypothetical protein